MCFIPTRRVQDNPRARPRRGARVRSRTNALAPLLWALASCETQPAQPLGARGDGAPVSSPIDGLGRGGAEARGPWALLDPRSGAPDLPREGELSPLSALSPATDPRALAARAANHAASHAASPTASPAASPAASPVANPAANPAAALAPLEVRALLIAEGVRRRSPVGVASRFPHTVGHLWGLVELHNPLAVRQIRLRWRHRGELKGDFPFAVGRGLKWREWSRVLVNPEDLGEWTLELYDVERAQVSQVSRFEVYSSETSAMERPERRPERAPERPPERPPERAPERAPERTPERAPERPQDTTEQRSAVERLVVATGVKHRLPVGVDSRFSGVERVWGYLEVNHSGPPTALWMEWAREGETRSRLSVKVGESARWRTWSWQRLRPQRDAGRWEVRVTTAGGEVLARAQFIIE